jgi:hypothetical protein
MDWFKKHVDAVIILVEIIIWMFWVNMKFNEIHIHFNSIILELKEIKNIMPNELAKTDDKEI